jgi:hypothetical protein
MQDFVKEKIGFCDVKEFTIPVSSSSFSNPKILRFEVTWQWLPAEKEGD